MTPPRLNIGCPFREDQCQPYRTCDKWTYAALTKWAVAFKPSGKCEAQKETCSLNSFRTSMQPSDKAIFSCRDQLTVSSCQRQFLFGTVHQKAHPLYSSAYDEHLNISSALPHERHMFFLSGVFCTDSISQHLRPLDGKKPKPGRNTIISCHLTEISRPLKVNVWNLL